MNALRSEPVLVLGLVQSVVGLVLAFGVRLSPDQMAAILTVTAAVLSVVCRTVVTVTPPKP